MDTGSFIVWDGPYGRNQKSVTVLIGEGHPTYIIAEIGVNHNGIPQLAFELIDIAVDAGACG